MLLNFLISFFNSVSTTNKIPFTSNYIQVDIKIVKHSIARNHKGWVKKKNLFVEKCCIS